MKALLPLLFCIFISGCAAKSTFPEEFVGTWEFDVNAAREGIKNMKINDADKAALESSFIDLAKGQIKTVLSTGVVKFPGVPDSVIIKLHVVNKRDDGYILSTTNSMSVSATERLSLDRIENGIWRTSSVDENLHVISKLPDNYWKRITK